MSNPTKVYSDEDYTRIIKNAAYELGAVFESVQIICTLPVENNTMLYSAGHGNHFARIGSVEVWLDSQIEEGFNTHSGDESDDE